MKLFKFFFVLNVTNINQHYFIYMKYSHDMVKKKKRIIHLIKNS